MALRGTSGQVMLTSAFILAIIIVFLALVLNNIIYFNNISYIGFMDQSGYDDISIKNLVAQEAYNTYQDSHGDPSAFNAHMQDLVQSLNDNTLSKGVHVSLTTPTIAPWGTSPSTVSALTISSKGSSKTYSISTNFGSSTPVPPAPGSGSLLCTVTMTANKTSLNLLEYALITVRVINTSDSHPLGGVTANLSSSLGEFDDAYGTVVSSVVTDVTGTATVYYIPTSVGVDHLNARVGLNPSYAYHNLSADVVVTNSLSTPCTHIVTIGNPGAPQTGHNGNNYWISVAVPITVTGPQAPIYNFSSFSVGAVFNSAGSTNMQFLSPSDMGNFTEPGYVRGPGSYSRNIVVKLGRPDRNGAYTADFTIFVIAHCEVDNSQYTISKTVTVAGS